MKTKQTPNKMTKSEKEQLMLKNAEFNALSPMKKRVAVAKDVLLQIKAGKFIPGYGYGSLRGPRGGRLSPSKSDSLQLVIEKNGVTCVGCAKGAAVIARARLGNEVLGRVDNSAESVTQEIFGEKLADILEMLYEGWGVEWTQLSTKGEVAAMKRYAASLPWNRSDCMITLYQNIVFNRGWFVVGKYKY